MTAITGETGAGKSLIIDALGLALGDRGDIERIKQGADRAEVSASFVINNNIAAQQWLSAQQLDQQLSQNKECLVRRTLVRDGRSRGFINGQAVTMAQLRELGSLVIDIHHQHEHQSLLRRDQQRLLLDEFGGYQALVEQVASSYFNWLDTKTRLEELHQSAANLAMQVELLSFQKDELEQVGLVDGEVENLEQQQALLANAEAILADSQKVLSLCDQNENADEQLTILGALNKACAILEGMPHRNAMLNETLTLLDSARIQVIEALAELKSHVTTSQVDPVKLEQVEQRLSLAYQLARKHKVKASELPALHLKLSEQLASITTSTTRAASLLEELEKLAERYLTVAKKLGKARAKTATKFCSAVNSQLAELAMAGATIEIALQTPSEPRYSATGLESVELLVSTNPGQAHRPLNKVASGGELSRISLAIQVVGAEHSTIPALVFDEVDVGVGGTTASVIGKLLRKLGDKGQVICISHQAPVASYANHHLVATKYQPAATHSKASEGVATESGLLELDMAQRTKEIARMLGGEKITKKTLSHAAELLAVAECR